MNPEHLQQCADAGYKECDEHLSEAARLAFAQAAISTYLKLNPVWVRASERMPTREDADKEGTVGMWSDYTGFSYCRFCEVQPQYFWTSIKHLPPPSDPFEDWLAKQPDDVRAADKELVKKIYNSIKP
jgi:hypothetical protein